MCAMLIHLVQRDGTKSDGGNSDGKDMGSSSGYHTCSKMGGKNEQSK